MVLIPLTKRYIYQLMSNVQPPGSKRFDSQIRIHSCIHKNDVSLAKTFQKNMSKEHRKHGVIDQVKYRKRSSKRKWTDREYHVQDNADVAHKDVKFIVIPTNSQHYHFVVHIQSLMEQGG